MKKGFTMILLTFSVIILVFAINIRKKDDFLPIETVLAEKTTIINQVIAQGNIEEFSKSYVSINQNGVVEKLNFALGDSVEIGDEIMTINIENTQQNQSYNSVIDLINNKNITILDTSNLGEIKVISNVNGIITSISSAESQAIFSGIPFLSICDNENLVARVSISEKNIKEIEIGQEVSITGDCFEGVIYGKVAQIMPYTTSNLDILSGSSTVSVETVIEIPQITQDIIIGCSIEAKITVDEKENAITIPFDAIYQENMQEFVYILQNNTIFEQNITTGYEIFENIEVLSGLNEGDIVVITEGVFDGQEVQNEQ